MRTPLPPLSPLLLATGLALGLCTPGVAKVDHHVHLIGPDLLRDWKSLGVPFSRTDEVYHAADGLLGPGGAESKVDGVVLVSMAHLYGRASFRGELGLPLEQERARVARENDHVARQAARTPGRAVAFCSVAVLRPYAEAELDRCHAELGVAGVKLHLAASDVDLTDATHLEVIGRILARAEQRRQPVLLHVDPQRRGLVANDIARFARTVLEPRRELTLIVAHLGGSGGYGPWTRQVFSTLVDWLEERRAAGDPRPRVFFDTSAVILEEESEGVPPTTPEEAAALGRDLRQAGLGRIVLGSDYPVFDPHRTLALLAERAGLTPEEIATVVANQPVGLLSADERELRHLKEDLWPRAYREGDRALLDRILAAEFQMVDADGNESTKAAELDWVSKNKAKNRSFRFEIQRLEVFENGTAIVAGRGVAVGPESDPDGGYVYQSTNVLIRRDGRWQAIASHVSGVKTFKGSTPPVNPPRTASAPPE